MRWLVDVLDAALPELTGARRDELAGAILEALPAQLISAVIRESTACVLKQRAIPDGAGDLAREIGNNCAASLVLVLRVDEDELDVAPAQEASSLR